MGLFIDFEPVGRRGECPPGSTLLDCARHLGVDLVNLCGGTGTCGRCKIQILSGEVSEPTGDEETFLTPAELALGFRLACRAVPLSSCKVRVPPESLTTPQRTQVEGEETAVAPEPVVRSYVVEAAPPSLDDLRSDAERVLNALTESLRGTVQIQTTDLGALRQLSGQLREEGWRTRVCLRGGELVAVLPPARRPLGLAVDLGTTKIAGYLVDLETGHTLASQGQMNPQIAYGEDLIARLGYAIDSPGQAEKMQELVVSALNQMVTELCTDAGAAPSQVVEVVVVGNTAMHHLLLQLPVKQLVQAPYLPAVQHALDVKARELGLRIAPGAYVHLLPIIAGYVGADHVAMLLASGVHQVDGVVLALDIGTNTEVCLANQGRLTSLSCASGPAFEGAHIRHGMRAAEGAIEHLRIVDGRIEYQTIGEAPAVGLCGSGILDTLAQLFQAGIVDARGRMGDHASVRDEGPAREVVIVPGEEMPDSVLPREGRDRPLDITFTQKDVRELQLAKGAMRTGIEVLLQTHGLAEHEIDQVIIAGAFGTYIDVKSAISIGMLPRLPLERFRQVGNAAGMGAKMALLSASKRAEAQALAQRVGYVELATVPGFSQIFAQSMYLGEDLFTRPSPRTRTPAAAR
jgi:uncharacterized 2Fe-2S/4Fe-4S cluster protein (DUF4445 family)